VVIGLHAELGRGIAMDEYKGSDLWRVIENTQEKDRHEHRRPYIVRAIEVNKGLNNESQVSFFEKALAHLDSKLSGDY
jgi:hypothetical protein